MSRLSIHFVFCFVFWSYLSNPWELITDKKKILKFSYLQGLRVSDSALSQSLSIQTTMQMVRRGKQRPVITKSVLIAGAYARLLYL